MATTGTGGPADRRVEAAVLVADSPRADVDDLSAFARRMARDAAAELGSAPDVP